MGHVARSSEAISEAAPKFRVGDDPPGANIEHFDVTAEIIKRSTTNTSQYAPRTIEPAWQRPISRAFAMRISGGLTLIARLSILNRLGSRVEVKVRVRP